MQIYFENKVCPPNRYQFSARKSFSNINKQIPGRYHTLHQEKHLQLVYNYVYVPYRLAKIYIYQPFSTNFNSKFSIFYWLFLIVVVILSVSILMFFLLCFNGIYVIVLFSNNKKRSPCAKYCKFMHGCLQYIFPRLEMFAKYSIPYLDFYF